MLAGQPLKLRPSYQQNQTQHIPDGMQPYSVDQRLAAAKTLYANTHNSVADECESTAEEAGGILGGVVGGLLGGPLGVGYGFVIGNRGGDAACGYVENNIANQLVNCFAFDACADTSDRWKSSGPGTGIAVSPDNILDWDVPTQKNSDGTYNGTYGYNEPIAYLPAVFRHKYVWAKSTGTGALTVKVEDENGKPYPNTATILIDSNIVGSTGSTATLTLSTLAAGKYIVEAQYSPCAHTGTPPEPPATPDTPLEQLPTCSSAGNVAPEGGCRAFVGSPLVPKGKCPDASYKANCKVQSILNNNPPQNAIGSLDEVCGCYPNPKCDALAQGFANAEVKDGDDDTHSVTIRLCSNGGHACRQSCVSDDNCGDSSLQCQDSLCTALPRAARIIWGFELYAYHKGGLFSKTTRTAESYFMPDMYCVPTIVGGTGVVDYAYCGKNTYGDDTAQFVFHATCDQDDTTGGITVLNEARLDKGCGGGAERLDDDVMRWTVALLPTSDKTGEYDVTSCWQASGEMCSENEVHAEFVFQSVPWDPAP